jgi:hypothetical protein
MKRAPALPFLALSLALLSASCAASRTHVAEGVPQRVEHTPAALVPMLMGVGFSAEVAHLLADLDDALHHGRLTFEHPERMVRGRTTLDEVLGDLLRAIGALPYMGAGTGVDTTVSP